MDLASTIYLICFLVGLGFAVISAFLSGVFGHFHIGVDHDVDVGGHEVEIGGHDVEKTPQKAEFAEERPDDIPKTEGKDEQQKDSTPPVAERDVDES